VAASGTEEKAVVPFDPARREAKHAPVGYDESIAEGDQDYTPDDDDDPEDDGGDAWDEGEWDEGDEAPEDDFEGGEILDTRTRALVPYVPGHVLGANNDLAPVPARVGLPAAPVAAPLPPPAVLPAVGAPLVGPMLPGVAAPAAPLPLALAPPAGTAPVVWTAPANQGVPQVFAGPLVMPHIRAFDQAVSSGIGICNQLIQMQLPGVPELIRADWQVPQEPTPGAADTYAVRCASNLREVQGIATRAVALLRSLRAPLVAAAVAQNQCRRVQEATATRESIRDQNAALQAQIQANRRAIRQAHLRQDRPVA
jgi:hypothetical protein